MKGAIEMAVSKRLCVDGKLPSRILRDRLVIEIPKGKKDDYRQIAGEFGISLARLIQLGVEEYAKNHAGEAQGDGVESAKAE